MALKDNNAFFNNCRFGGFSSECVILLIVSFLIQGARFVCFPKDKLSRFLSETSPTFKTFYYKISLENGHTRKGRHKML